MIRFIGTLKGTKLDSKVEDGNVVHTVAIKLEITEGVDAVHDIVERLKEVVQVEIDPKQPHLTRP